MWKKMWNKTWKWTLKAVMNYIVGADVFGQVQKMVAEAAADDKLSGAEKKEKVLASAKNLGVDFASHMLNLAIEAAVTLLKDETK